MPTAATLHFTFRCRQTRHAVGARLRTWGTAAEAEAGDRDPLVRSASIIVLSHARAAEGGVCASNATMDRSATALHRSRREPRGGQVGKMVIYDRRAR